MVYPIILTNACICYFFACYCSPINQSFVCTKGHTYRKNSRIDRQKVGKIHAPVRIQLSASASRPLQTATRIEQREDDDYTLTSRRILLGLSFGLISLTSGCNIITEAAGLPPEEKPKLCDPACEKELENVW